MHKIFCGFHGIVSVACWSAPGFGVEPMLSRANV
jgi:hypothetical protein